MSYCNRLKVGATAVRDNRPILSSWNGTPTGSDNCCEETKSRWVTDEYGLNGKTEYYTVTKDEVSHAEENLITWAAKEGISLNGCTLYVTHNPCVHCAKLIKKSGIEHVVWKDQYRSDAGLNYFTKYQVKTTQYTKT